MNAPYPFATTLCGSLIRWVQETVRTNVDVHGVECLSNLCHYAAKPRHGLHASNREKRISLPAKVTNTVVVT